MIINSYAKLNLYLEVLGKRPDNYHDLKTVFERISLSDKIFLKLRKDKEIMLSSSSAQIPNDSTNLAYRSAKLLQDTFKVNKGVEIRIDKRIPVGAGLGGGSGNAAYVLMGLNKLWKLGLTREKLALLAKKIGADVPFFIYDAKFALAQGVGEKVKPLPKLDSLRLWHILIVPRIHVPTPLIFRKWDKINPKPGLTTREYDVTLLISALEKKDFIALGASLFNSLEAVTIKLHPELKRIKERLAKAGLKSILMSGSGPAVFGIVSSRKEAVSLYNRLRGVDDFWQVFMVKTV